MFDMSLFSERLKAARQQKGISQAELAQAVGVTAATISSYENSKNAKIPALDKAYAMAEALDVGLDRLCGYENEDAVDARKILCTFVFLLSHLKIDIITEGSMIYGEPRAFSLIGNDYKIGEFLKEYQKIQPVLEDDNIPEYLKNGLLETLYSKFKNYSYCPESKDFIDF